MAYVTVTDPQIAAGQPISTALVTQFRDNDEALNALPVASSAVLSRTVTSGSQSVIDISFDPTLYDAIDIYFVKLQNSAQSDFYLFLGSGVGPTFSTSYNVAASYLNITDFTVGINAGSGAAVAQVTLFDQPGNATGETGLSGKVTIFYPNETGKTHGEFSVMGQEANAGAFERWNGSFMDNTSQATNTVRLTNQSGTFIDGGIVTVVGTLTT